MQEGNTLAQWHYQRDARPEGPVSAQELARLLQMGAVNDDTLLWREGLAQWQTLGTVRPELGLGPARPPAPPPLPGAPAPVAPSKARRGLSGCAIAAIIAVACAVPVLAILAAIAIPAYQDYVTRAAVAQALLEAAPVQAQVQTAIAHTPGGQCPENGQPPLRAAIDYAGASLSSITIGRFETGACGMELVLHRPEQKKLDGKRIWLERAGETWTCSSELPDKVLPRQCRSSGSAAAGSP